MAWHDDSLVTFLRCLGFVPTASRSYWRMLLGLLVILTSFLAFIIESADDMTFYVDIFDGSLREVKIADIIERLKYIVKTAATFLVMVVFWRIRSAFLPFDTYCQDFIEVSCDSKMTLYSLLTFLFYLFIIIGTRVYSELSAPEKSFGTSTLSFLYNYQFQILVIGLRNFTEAFRLLLAAYLGSLLAKFKNGPVAEPKRMLQKLLLDYSIYDFELVVRTAQEAWTLREKALEVTEFIQEKLGLVLSVVLFTDVVSIISCFSDVLDPGLVPKQIRGVAYLSLYLVSSCNIVVGLLRIQQEEEDTLRTIRNIQSALAIDKHHSKHLVDHRPSGKGFAKPWGVRPDLRTKLETNGFLQAHVDSFTGRSVNPDLYAFGKVTMPAATRVMGVCIAFFCFVMDQQSRVVQTSKMLNNFKTAWSNNMNDSAVI